MEHTATGDLWLNPTPTAGAVTEKRKQYLPLAITPTVALAYPRLLINSFKISPQPILRQVGYLVRRTTLTSGQVTNRLTEFLYR
jgi:hypothetical protein